MRSICAFVVAMTAFAALAQDGAEDRRERAVELDADNESVRCIRAVSINRARPIDDATIAFYMSGGRVFLNYLPRRCPGMARHERIAYETSSGRLCRRDRVAVIYDTSGEDIGLPCPLGEFFPADVESVDLMLEAAQRGGASSPVTAEPVELPPEQESESD